MNDKVFAKPIKKQFEFDAEVAAVFDDMLQRSVPFYKESQKITRFFALKALQIALMALWTLRAALALKVIACACIKNKIRNTVSKAASRK